MTEPRFDPLQTYKEYPVDEMRRRAAGFRADGFVEGFADADPTSGPGPTPKNPLSWQYFELHQLRSAALGTGPTGSLRLRSSATWTPNGHWSVTGNLRLRNAVNRFFGSARRGARLN